MSDSTTFYDYEVSKIGKPEVYALSHAPTDAKFKKPMLKIGYTTDFKRRFKEISASVKMLGESDWKTIERLSAERPDGSVFMDHEIHAALAELWFHKRRGDDKGVTEFFDCSLDDFKKAHNAVMLRKKPERWRLNGFPMRPEQEDAVRKTSAYFSETGDKDSVPEFLWNAKMRFWKTFAAYKLAQEMGWKKIIILTYKPAVEDSWKNELAEHSDFSGWDFFKASDIPENSDNPIVAFSSFQDLLWKDSKTGSPKGKFSKAFSAEWDCVIVDEFHYWSWRNLAKTAYSDDETETVGTEADMASEGELQETLKDAASKIRSKHRLFLSGTPFRALSSGDFAPEQIFNWTYQDEQRAKAEWNASKWANPYASLPEMAIMTYQMPDSVRKIVEEDGTDEFTLNEFFAAERKEGEPVEKSVFKYRAEVVKWLEFLFWKLTEENRETFADRKNRPILPFWSPEMIENMRHTIWYLPSVGACHAMKEAIRDSEAVSVMVAAGNDAWMGKDALVPVREAIGKNGKLTRTITLTCGKLLTGVSVPEWTGILILNETKTPEAYFQAAFRVQTPWVAKDYEGNESVLKTQCFVFDFSPNRALGLIQEYSGMNDPRDARNPEDAIGEFISFMPVLSYDRFSMKRLDAMEIMQMAASGTTTSFLVQKFKSGRLICLNTEAMEKVFGNPRLMEALNGIESFRKLNKERPASVVISTEESLKSKISKGEPLSEEENEEKKKNRDWKKEVRDLLLKFVARIPVFMYLTDDRESKLVHVIENVEPGLFSKTTGISIENFKLMREAGVFNERNLNSAILSFREYEESSLAYGELRARKPGVVQEFSGTMEAPVPYAWVR